MLFRVFLLFTCIPLVELYILLQIGSVIGAANTILLVVFTGVLGAYLAQREGIRTLRTIQALLARGEIPGAPLLDAFLILLAGVVLITPGVLTDLLGFLVLFPVTRARIRRWMQRHLERRFASADGTIYFRGPQ